MKKRYFTLVELLVVVGIVVILAGLVLPAVIGGAQQGRITQAKSDMKSIQLALAQMDQTYSRILVVSSATPPVATFSTTASGTTTVTADRKASDSNLPSGSDSTAYVVVGPGNTAAYNSLIAELTGTGNKSGSLIPYRHNQRRIKFLDPNANFNPAEDYDSTANAPLLWRDPWGNPYTIMINVDGHDRIVRPDDNSRYIMGKTAVYSWGPNGENNNGRNIAEGGINVDKLDDDIATWHK